MSALAGRDWHRQPRTPTAIGVGYDASPEAEAALVRGAGLADVFGARLHVRRVVDHQPTALGRTSPPRDDAQQASECERARGETERAVLRLADDAEISVTAGDPGYELRDRSEVVDLLVVGSRGWGPVGRVVNGSVGETLVADAGCSIILVPRSATD